MADKTAAEKKADQDVAERSKTTEAAEEQAAEVKAAEVSRGDIEAAAGAGLLPNLTTTSASGVSLPVGTDPVTAEAAANMIVNSERSEGNREFVAPTSPEHEKRVAEARKAAAKTTPEVDRGNRTLRELASALSPAADVVDIVEPIPAPGQTERGWSPEVTARHPAVEAAMLDEMAGALGAGGPRKAGKIEGIDPTDRVAVANALREQGFHEQRKIDLRNQAHREAAVRLAAAEGTRDLASPHGIAAMSELADELRDNARANGH